MTVVTHRDLKWMQLCNIAAGIFSTCAKRQYFAIVVGLNGRVVGLGYNGGPSGMPHCTDGGCPRAIEGSPSGSNYDNCISIHAEENALLWSDRTDRDGATLIINGTPCWGCAKKIAGSGIRRLIYILDPAYADWPRAKALLEQAGVQCFNVELPDADPGEWGHADDFHAWLLHGHAKKWVTEVVCGTHDGLPMTDAQIEDDLEETYDDCVYVMRILEDNIGPQA